MEEKIEQELAKADLCCKTEDLSRPDSVIILGKRYEITYTDKPSDVDIYQRESMWGQIDLWTRTIRIYDNRRSIEDLWETILHEVLHGIVIELNIKTLDGDDHEDDIDILALALMNVMFSNRWLREEIMNESGKRSE